MYESQDLTHPDETAHGARPGTGCDKASASSDVILIRNLLVWPSVAISIWVLYKASLLVFGMS